MRNNKKASVIIHRQINTRNKMKNYMFYRIVVFILLFCLVFNSTLIFNNDTIVNAAWWNSSWDYCTTYTIHNEFIENDLSNIPILFPISSTIAGKSQANGEDIRFVNAANTSEYYYDIVQWNSSATSYVFVNVTSVSSSSDTIVNLYYGNAGASTNENEDNTWDSNYTGVFHLEETTGSGSTCVDSSGYWNNGTYGGNLPRVISGQVGHGQDFDGVNDNISLPGGCQVFTSGTVEIWFSCDVLNQDMTIHGQYDTASMEDFFYHRVTSGSKYMFNGEVGNVNQWTGTTTELTSTSWVYTAHALTTNDIALQVNTSVLLSDSSASTPNVPYEDIYIGRTQTGSTPFNGQIDEILISSVRRNQSWLNVSFHSLNQSTGFITLGDEQMGSVKAPTGFAASTSSTSQIDLSWTIGVNATHTLVERNTISSWSRGSGTQIYNSTGTSYGDTYGGFSCGTVYYYQAWGYNSTLNTWSGYVSANNITCPSNPTNSLATAYDGYVNLTWTTGTYADNTLVVRKSGSFPSSPSDGTIRYNGSLEYYNDSGVTTTMFYTLFSWNNTINQFSTGVQRSWGSLSINVYDENCTSNCAIYNWDIFISNSDKTSTYESTGNNNTKIIDVSELPYGTNTMIRINATNYNFKIYYMDLAVNTHYDLNAFISLRNQTSSYVIRVVDEIQNPVDSAKVYFKRYINESVGYGNTSILLTDANGYCTVSLIPNEDYAVTVTKEGYVTKTSDLFPLPIIYGDERYHTLQINSITTTYENIFDNITYEIQPDITIHNTSITFYFNITNSDSDFEYFRIKVYYYNATQNIWIHEYTATSTTSTGGSLSYTTNNTAGLYGFQCEFKRENWDEYTFAGDYEYMFLYTIYHADTADTIIDKDDLNTIINNAVGESPVYNGDATVVWTSLGAAIAVTAFLFTFAPKLAGFGVMAVAGVLGFFKQPLGLILETDISTTSIVLIFLFGLIVLIIAMKKGWG